jgi:hypothetical protein
MAKTRKGCRQRRIKRVILVVILAILLFYSKRCV